MTDRKQHAARPAAASAAEPARAAPDDPREQPGGEPSAAEPLGVDASEQGVDAGEQGVDAGEQSEGPRARAHARTRADADGRDARPGAAVPADDGDGAGDDGSVSGARDGGAADIEGDLDELVAVAQQRDEYLALAQRTQADFENYKKRVARESALAQERGVAKLAKELLPALDNLDRALQAAAEDDPLLEGLRLVRSELNAALARVGVECFSPLGESFDPALHEAMASTEQPPGGAAGGTVVEVYQAGYRLGSSIIRPARVVVAA